MRKRAKNQENNLKRLHVFFQGRVQGVGFRYATELIACRLGVTGWVRNCPDGTVEVMAEGDEQKLNQLLEGIRKSTVGGYIETEDAHWSNPTGEFTGFRVEFYY